MPESLVATAVQFRAAPCSWPELKAGMETLAGEAAAQGAALVLFPAHTGFLALRAMAREPVVFGAGLAGVVARHGSALREAFEELGSTLARRIGLYLAPGTVFLPVTEGGETFHHWAYLFGPRGELVGKQAQTHAGARARAWGMETVSFLSAFTTDLGTVGFAVDEDILYPEVSRVLALQGADILLVPRAVPAPYTPARQLAGTWQEVQQNQVFALESGLEGETGGMCFEGRSAIFGPCEITKGASGFLAPPGGFPVPPGGFPPSVPGEDLAASGNGPARAGEGVHPASGQGPEQPEGGLAPLHRGTVKSRAGRLVTAVLDFAQLARIREEYPIFGQFNYALYDRFLPGIYGGAGVPKAQHKC